jgi:hypothetical protein
MKNKDALTNIPHLHKDGGIRKGRIRKREKKR